MIAEWNGSPVAQVWVDLTKKKAEETGVLWAIRVRPELQNQGIGSQLLAAAERRLRKRQFAWAELSVAKDNIDARRMYERAGYRLVDAEHVEFTYTTPEGVNMTEAPDVWILRKALRSAGRQPARIEPLEPVEQAA